MRFRDIRAAEAEAAKAAAEESKESAPAPLYRTSNRAAKRRRGGGLKDRRRLKIYPHPLTLGHWRPVEADAADETDAFLDDEAANV